MSSTVVSAAAGVEEEEKKAADGERELPEGFDVIREGSAAVLYSKEREVFYNRVQIFNRDLSIAVIQQYIDLRAEEEAARAEKRAARRAAAAAAEAAAAAVAEAGGEGGKAEEAAAGGAGGGAAAVDGKEAVEGVRILEALSATGLRSIRYFKELTGVKQVIANDLDSDSVEAIRRNVEFNGLSTEQVVPHHGDATTVMYAHRPRGMQFDVIDLDPFGSAHPFLDSAVQAVRSGGLLCVTCTDMAVLSGNNTETCWSKYGAMPLRNSKYCHELALRIVLQSVQSAAGRYGRYVVPLVSVSVDYYVRVFVRVFASPKEVKRSMLKLATVYQCTGCNAFHLEAVGRRKPTGAYVPALGPLVGAGCDECGRKFHIGGPVWSPAIHDFDFVSAVKARVDGSSEERFASKTYVSAMLGVIEKELPDVPLFYTLGGIAASLHCNTPPLPRVMSALRNAGFRTSASHCKPGSIKTDAPASVMYDILRCWVREHPIKASRLADGSACKAILDKPPTLEADFTLDDIAKNAKKTRVPRFLPNPEPHWGPGTHSKTRKGGKKSGRKSKEKQEKRARERAARKDEERKKRRAGDSAEQPEEKRRRVEDGGAVE